MDIAVVGAGAAVTLDETDSLCCRPGGAGGRGADASPRPEAGSALVDGVVSDALIERAATLAQAAADLSATCAAMPITAGTWWES